MTKIVNAKIIDTMLGFEDHNIFTFMLTFEMDGTGQGYGGYALDKWDEIRHKRIGSKLGTEAVMRILKTVGVDKWERLKGQYVRLQYGDQGSGKIVAVGHIIKDQWFCMPDVLRDMGE